MSVSSFVRAVGDFILPQVCVFCGSEGIDQGRYPVCEQCLEGFLPIVPPACPRCGFPLQRTQQSHLCGECLQNPPPFETAWSPFLYTSKARDLVHLLKFRGNLAALSVMEFLFREKLDAVTLAGDLEILVPVPMDMDGLRRRGYNQALLIAEGLGRMMAIPVDRTHLIKSRATPPQIGLTRAQRKRNIRGAFSVRGRDAFEGKAVLLVDDVFTTGATARACSHVLKRAGARLVKVITFARAVPE